jgi:hypothetical protein
MTQDKVPEHDAVHATERQQVRPRGTKRTELIAVPSIKFYKDAIAGILNGDKTLEPRPRSMSWIRRLQRSQRVHLTYGPRFGPPSVFAVAQITDITLRPFDTATPDDLERVGAKWRGRRPDEFVAEYTKWFRLELGKGYPVAWISFQVCERYPPAPQEVLDDV